MFSVICVYNSKQILAEYLLKSLQQQDAEYELIQIDNTQGQFDSAAKALNWGAKGAKGRYLMFVHQDVQLSSVSWLRDAEQMMNEIPDLGAAGAVGAGSDRAARRKVVGNVRYGFPAADIPGLLPIGKPEKVQTLDECLLIVPDSVFHRIQFDETVCDHWHLYGVDYCLSIADLGFNAYVLPLPTYHMSLGIYNSNICRLILGMGLFAPEYYRALGRMLNKHKDRVARVYATTGKWETRRPLLFQRLMATVDAAVDMIVDGWLRHRLYGFVTKLRIRHTDRNLHP